MIESLYLKVYIGIVVSHNKSDVIIEMIKGTNTVKRSAKSFLTTEVNDDMRAFVSQAAAESPYFYIALLNHSKHQGAIPTCSTKKAVEYADISTAKTLCYKKRWMVYASKPDLDLYQKRYSDFGLDFIFSPYILLERFFSDKVEGAMALYVMVQEDILSLAIFEKNELLYASHFDVEESVEETLISDDEKSTISLDFNIEGEGIDEGIHLDDIDAIDALEDIDDLSGFDDIEDLDTIDDIEEFAEVEEVAKPAEANLDELDTTGDPETMLESFNEDYQRFTLLQRALQQFYSETKVENAFIEHVYIADTVGVSEDLKRYLEEELFLSVVIREMDRSHALIELAKEEAQYAI